LENSVIGRPGRRVHDEGLWTRLKRRCDCIPCVLARIKCEPSDCASPPMSKTNLFRPSRDGDQFHYLWAARRCLKLLSSDSGLVAVSIEGPSPDEQPGRPPVRTHSQTLRSIAQRCVSKDGDRPRPCELPSFETRAQERALLTRQRRSRCARMRSVAQVPK
jgi:hypothetical protein